MVAGFVLGAREFSVSSVPFSDGGHLTYLGPDRDTYGAFIAPVMVSRKGAKPRRNIQIKANQTATIIIVFLRAFA